MREQHLAIIFDTKELGFKSFKEDAGVQYWTPTMFFYIQNPKTEQITLDFSVWGTSRMGKDMVVECGRGEEKDKEIGKQPSI